MTSDSWTPGRKVISSLRRNVNDIRIGRKAALPKGQVYVLTKGLVYYKLHGIRSTVQSLLVTRLKSNAVSTSGGQNPRLVPPANRRFWCDYLVSYSNYRASRRRNASRVTTAARFRQKYGSGAKRRQAPRRASYQRPGNARPTHLPSATKLFELVLFQWLKAKPEDPEGSRAAANNAARCRYLRSSIHLYLFAAKLKPGHFSRYIRSLRHCLGLN